MPQDKFFALVMHLVVVEEATALAGFVDGPAGEAARDLDDILLRVAAVDAQRMEFHQFTRVIFVQATLYFPVLGFGVQIRLHGLKIVQVEKHGRTLGRGLKQGAELAEHVGADGVAVIRRDQEAVRSFVVVDIEMIEPEVRHFLGQLAVAVDCTHQFRFQQVISHHLLRGVHEQNLAADLRGCNVEEWLAHGAGQSDHQVVDIGCRDGCQQRLLCIGFTAAEGLDLGCVQNLLQRPGGRQVV